MHVRDAVMTRRSFPRLKGPAPTDAEFRELVQLAATAPDHGRLHPWRWVLLRDAARDELAHGLANDHDVERQLRRVRRAPLLASLVFAPRDRAVPEWEQLAAAVTMTTTLILLLHEAGYGSMWRTGPATEAACVRQLLNFTGSERSLGWLYVGQPNGAPPVRPALDVASRISTL